LCTTFSSSMGSKLYPEELAGDLYTYTVSTDVLSGCQ
jgi:hypothetical protein